MPLSGMLTCGSCGARTQMNTMRYNLSGSKLICQNCVDKERSSIKPGTTHATSMRLQREQIRRDVNEKTERSEAPERLRPTGAAGVSAGKAGSNGVMSYLCRSCHFKFSRKKDMEITSCPYCGRQTVTTAFEGGAQDLIEEATRAEEEMF